jgi:glycosyltransferase involved in cell wall biosynthesis
VQHPALDFQLRYLFPQVQDRQQRGHTFNLWQVFKTARALAAEQPDLLIVSLWRSALAGLLVRLLRPRTRMVVFLHNSVDAHAADFVLTRLAIAFAHEVWADSEASVNRRFRRPLRPKVRTISFLARALVPDERAKPVAPTFAFWGRLSAQKDLPRALRLFARVRERHPEARYLIIGPEGDDTERVKATIETLGLAASVQWLGPMAFDDIVRRVQPCCFYLQTSRYEGMAMSVVEAMQLGLVPVVSPVGEIACYCLADVNAVVVDDDERACDELLLLLQRPDVFTALRARAMQHWQQQPVYSESVLAACRAALD